MMYYNSHSVSGGTPATGKALRAGNIKIGLMEIPFLLMYLGHPFKNN
jgi:hypothetical protein